MRVNGGRILLGDNRLQGGHIEADYVTVFCILHFIYTPLYLPTYLTTCIISSELYESRSDLPVRAVCDINYSINQLRALECVLHAVHTMAAISTRFDTFIVSSSGSTEFLLFSMSGLHLFVKIKPRGATQDERSRCDVNPVFHISCVLCRKTFDRFLGAKFQIFTSWMIKIFIKDKII